MWCAGSGWRHTWLLSLANQALWLIWIVATSNWGFLPMNIAMWVVAVRNHLEWKKCQPLIAKMKANQVILDQRMAELDQLEREYHVRERAILDQAKRDSIGIKGA